MQVPRDGLVQKLQKLTASQQSIESVASFCIFYHKDARGVVTIWDGEFYQAPPERRLALLYLANHILQEGRRTQKGGAFLDEFYRVLPKAIKESLQRADDKTRRSITRIVAVWDERRVFGSKHIKTFKDLIEGTGGGGAGAGAGGSGTPPGGNRMRATPLSRSLSLESSRVMEKLGAAGETLMAVSRAAEATTAANTAYNKGWKQEVLVTGGPQELSSAGQLVGALVSQLQSELASRRLAVGALRAELASQEAAIQQAQARLPALQQQQAGVEQRMAALANQTAAAALNGGGAGAGSASILPGGRSPQAPGLDDDDDILEGLTAPGWDDEANALLAQAFAGPTPPAVGPASASEAAGASVSGAGLPLHQPPQLPGASQHMSYLQPQPQVQQLPPPSQQQQQQQQYGTQAVASVPPPNLQQLLSPGMLAAIAAQATANAAASTQVPAAGMASLGGPMHPGGGGLAVPMVLSGDDDAPYDPEDPD